MEAAFGLYVQEAETVAHCCCVVCLWEEEEGCVVPAGYMGGEGVLYLSVLRGWIWGRKKAGSIIGYDDASLQESILGVRLSHHKSKVGDKAEMQPCHDHSS
jgi:hypothetical protein